MEIDNNVELKVEAPEVTGAIQEPEPKQEEKKKNNFSFVKNIMSEAAEKAPEVKEEKIETKEEKPKFKRLEEKTTDELINDVKHWMSIAETRKVEIEKNSKNPSTVPDEKYTKFFEGLKSDFFGTYKDYADEFGLPSIQYLQQQMSTGGDREARIQQWQEKELIPSIEKKFNIESGTFISDPTELYKKGTPTEYFRRMTEMKEKEMDSLHAEEQKRKEEVLGSIVKQRNDDLDYIEKTFYGEDKESFNKKISEFDSIPDKVLKGELSQDMNPFSIRNIFRGVYFEELAEAKMKKAISDIHKQYNALGLFLPNKSGPVDATEVKGDPKEIKDASRKNSFSMIKKQFNN